MVMPSRIKTRISRCECEPLLEREYKILSSSEVQGNYYVDLAKRQSYLQWRETAPDVLWTFSGKRPVGPAWRVEPLPLSSKEERALIKAGRWHSLKHMRYGDYEVGPFRGDLKWIQRIFWASREIRSATRIISLNPQRYYINILKDFLSAIRLLGNNGKTRTGLQCKLSSDVYYCLRQCNRLKDDEKALLELTP
jgi:hypothetical protein